MISTISEQDMQAEMARLARELANSNSPSTTYIGVVFPIRTPGFLNDAKLSAYVEIMDAHAKCFEARTGARVGWVYDIRSDGPYDFYMDVEPSAVDKYLAEVRAQFPSCEFVPGINPMTHLYQYVAAEMQGEAA